MSIYDIKIRYLASTFVDAQSITPTIGEMGKLAEKIGFQDSVSNRIMGSDVGGKLTEGVALSTPNTGLNLFLLPNRFDVQLLPIDAEGSNFTPFNEFIDQAKELLAETVSFFGREGHRVAAVTEGLLPEMNENEMRSISDILFHFPPSHLEFPPFEWNCRLASRIIRNFAESTEDTNTITTFSRISGTFGKSGDVSIKTDSFDRIRVDLDINTSPESTVARFDSGKIKLFFDSLKGWHNELEEQTVEFMGRS